MAQTYEIELPNGSIIEFVGEKPPTSAQLKKLVSTYSPPEKKKKEPEAVRPAIPVASGGMGLLPGATPVTRPGDPNNLLAQVVNNPEFQAEGTRLGGAMTGATMGAIGGGGTPLSIPLAILGGIGGALAVEPLATSITPREETLGESAANVLTGGLVVPSARGVSAVPRIIGEASQGAASGIMHKSIQTGFDEGRLPSLEEAAPYAAGGTAFGGIFGAIGARLDPDARPSVVNQVDSKVDPNVISKGEYRGLGMEEPLPRFEFDDADFQRRELAVERDDFDVLEPSPRLEFDDADFQSKALRAERVPGVDPTNEAAVQDIIRFREELGLPPVRKRKSETNIQKEINDSLRIAERRKGKPLTAKESLEYQLMVRDEAEARNAIDDYNASVDEALEVGFKQKRASVDAAEQTALAERLRNEAVAPTGAPDPETGPTIQQAMGQTVITKDGIEGTLIQTDDGTFAVLPLTQERGQPTRFYEIEGAGKDPTVPLQDIGAAIKARPLAPEVTRESLNLPEATAPQSRPLPTISRKDEPVNSFMSTKPADDIQKAQSEARQPLPKPKPVTPEPVAEDIVSQYPLDRVAELAVVQEQLAKGGARTATNESEPGYRYTRFFNDSDVANAARYVLESIDEAIRSVAPSVWGGLMNYEMAGNKLRVQFNRVANEFGQRVRSVLTPEQWGRLRLSVLNRDTAGIEQIVKEAGENGHIVMYEYTRARNMLDSILKLERDAGRDVRGLENYWPREVRDYNGLLNAMGREARSEFEQALADKQKKLGRKLFLHERDDVNNSTLQSMYRNGSGFKYMKSRTIRELDEKLSQFYYDIDESLHRYGTKAAQDITDRNWFGSAEVDNPDIGGTFGRLITDAQSGGLSPDNQNIVLENLKARRAMNRVPNDALTRLVNGLRNLTSISFLGDITANIPQLGDMAIAVQSHGFKSGGKSILTRLSDIPGNWRNKFTKGKSGFQKKSVSLEDIYLRLESDDYNQFNMLDKTRLSRVAESVLRKTVGTFDRLGKETVLQAAWNRYRSAANNPKSRDFKKFEEKYKLAWPEDWQNIVNDFKKGEMTDLTRLVLMTELSELQPILKSSMPRAYAENPRGRLIYTLKSFHVKQLNRMKREGLSKIMNGFRQKDPMLAMEGAMWLGQYLVFMGLVNSATDYTRDTLLGRDVEPEEMPIQNVFRAVGLSEFQLRDLGEQGAIRAGLNWAFPVGQVFEDVANDIRVTGDYFLGAGYQDPRRDWWEELGTPQYAPFIGKSLYHRTGRGGVREQNRAYENYRKGSSNSTIEAIEGLYRKDP